MKQFEAVIESSYALKPEETGVFQVSCTVSISANSFEEASTIIHEFKNKEDEVLQIVEVETTDEGTQ